MTMSVGFGKIVADPEATIRTRKALGTLSTPGLLVEDKGLTIDDSGRMVLRLKDGGGLSEDETGLSATESRFLRVLTGQAGFTLTYTDGVYDATITLVTGAVVGDTVIVSPIGSPPSGVAAWSGWVSAADTVEIRYLISGGSGGTISQSFRVTVIRGI